MEITKGRIHKPVKTVIYGPEGIGKSTIAARFPDPVFIDTEGSTSHMDVSRLPSPSSWQMLMEEVKYVTSDPSCCRTLIIDTADWAEKLCIEHVCASRKMGSIEDAGYGKGYTYLKEEFGKFLNLLNDVLDRGVNVVITAHAMMRKFEQPDELGAYDRWELKLSKQCAPLVKEWADMVLFCNYKTMVVNVDNQGAAKGKNKAQGGRRVMYTSHHPCWDAKNRFSLPEELPMEYEAIEEIINHSTTNIQEKETVKAETVPQTAPPEPMKKDYYPYAGPGEQISMEEVEHTQKIETTPPVDEAPPDPPKSQETAPKESAVVSPYASDPERIPENLKHLMQLSNITEWQIQDAVTAKGYYPQDTLLQDMDPEFIQGWIVAFWPKVKELIKDIKEQQGIPFN